jgi:hypothetical protein
MVVRCPNQVLWALFLVLKPSACQNIRSAQCPRNASLARKWHLQFTGPSIRCQDTALGVPTFYSWECPIRPFYCVLHALKQYQGNKVDSLGVPTFIDSIVFYSLCEDARQPSWVPGGAHIPRFYCVYTL